MCKGDAIIVLVTTAYHSAHGQYNINTACAGTYILYVHMYNGTSSPKYEVLIKKSILICKLDVVFIKNAIIVCLQLHAII